VERALDPSLLAAALGIDEGLPTAEELQRLIAEAEMRLFVAQPEVPPELVDLGWYLHAVASLVGEEYDRDRRIAAFRVSAHILELAMDNPRTPEAVQLQLAFGAQAGYRLGELDPNATAVFRRISKRLEPAGATAEHWEAQYGMASAMQLLSLQPREAFPALQTYRAILGDLRLRLGRYGFRRWAAAEHLVEASMATLVALRFGDTGRFDVAERHLHAVVNSDGPLLDRWVASHLVGAVSYLRAGSVWEVLGEDAPYEVKVALAGTSPPVLSLWPPQRALLRPVGRRSPLQRDTRRVVLSVPTSAGKTLVAQVLLLSEIASTGRSVCFVAPMRSLVREVRKQVLDRLRYLDDAKLGTDLPDWEAALVRDVLGDPTVEVMTPERLAAQLRHEPELVLAKYSMFIFDEAQLVSDGHRGFILEGVLTYLNWKTRQTDHRIVLMSAALGNDLTVRHWIDPDERGEAFTSPWRGPRRLLAVYKPLADQSTRKLVASPRAKSYTHRERFELRGDIWLRAFGTAELVEGEITEPVGWISYPDTPSGRSNPRLATGTPHYDLIAPLAVEVEHAGPVLTVTGRRDDAQRIATAIAKRRGGARGSVLLTELVRDRLGADHPLLTMVRVGVAFHHARLPTEILTAIEDELRGGALQHVVCTTTLTEGVNLPVRTVVLAEIQRRGPRRMSGARLINALGRAGRAGVETEGWVVFYANNMGPEDGVDFMAPDEEEVSAKSRLVNEEALAELADYEERLAHHGEAIFMDPPEAVRDFITFAWFVMSTEQVLGESNPQEALADALEHSLGYAQMGLSLKRRWASVGARVGEVFAQTESEERLRWSRSGLSVGSARRLSAMVDRVVEAAAALEGLDDAEVALRLLSRLGVLEDLLALAEAPSSDWSFKDSNDGAVFSPPLGTVLSAWIHGEDSHLLADRFLERVDDASARQELMTNAVSQVFDYFLSWTLGAVLDEVNSRVPEGLVGGLLCPELALFVRYGVDSQLALELMTRGIRSRRLALSVASEARAHEVSLEQLSVWLRAVDPVTWPERFEATATDVLDLLEFARDRSARTLRLLLRGETIRLELSAGVTFVGPAIIRATRSERGHEFLGLFAEGVDEPVASVPTASQADMRSIIGAGLPLIADIDEDGASVHVDRDALV
jgi:hypothetical protein